MLVETPAWGTPAPGHPLLFSGLSFSICEMVGLTTSVFGMLAGWLLETGLSQNILAQTVILAPGPSCEH